MEQHQKNYKGYAKRKGRIWRRNKKKKEEILRQIIQLRNIDIEDKQNYAKYDLKRAKVAAKEIMNECEETIAATNEFIYAGAYVTTEKLNAKPKNYNNRRKHKQPLWKTKIEKEINEIRGKVAISDELLRRVKVKSRKLN